MKITFRAWQFSSLLSWVVCKVLIWNVAYPTSCTPSNWEILTSPTWNLISDYNYFLAGIHISTKYWNWNASSLFEIHTDLSHTLGSFSPQHFIMKTFKLTEKVKEFYSEYLCTYHQNSAIHILLYLLYRGFKFFVYIC